MTHDEPAATPGAAPADAAVRCAPFHAALGVPSWGSAAAYEGFLFAEVPLPWPRDVTETGLFAELAGEVTPVVVAPDGRRWRPQAVVAPGAAGGGAGGAAGGGARGDDSVSVVAYDRPIGPARPYRRRGWVAPAEAAVELCRAVLAAGWAGEVPLDGPLAGVAVAAPVEGTEMYVCTHGRRDTCCGSLGTSLFESLAGRAELSGRVHRTSHTGGHKFAPTVLTFPDGYAWAHVDGPDEGRQLGAGGCDLAAGRCRGSSGFDDPAAQVLDVVALGRCGASWAMSERTAEVRPDGPGRFRVEVRAVLDGVPFVRVSGLVVETGRVPQPTCGTVDPDPATAPVWAVHDVALDEA